MISVSEKRIICENFIVAALDLIIEARGFDGEMLFIPQRDLRARDLLRNGRVPEVVLDKFVDAIEKMLVTAAAVSAHEMVNAT